ncbi:MAG: T6SS phospholipase effector Tle1-like catalytic domain-containing protein [Pseudomonadota bacterium]
MQLKRSMELTPYDLPRIESPFLAAAEVGRLISSGRLSGMDLRALLRARPDSREPLQTLATRQVADGDLFLIHGPFDPGPLSPVIDWRDNPELPAGGEWKPSSPLPFGLGYALQELNHRQLTPDDVKRGPIPGASGTSAEPARTSDQNPARTAPTATSASVMATTLAGIKLANESGRVPEKEQEPEIHVEVGIFTDGTLNNAFNSQQMEDIVDKECLIPFENNEIDQAECERRLGLLMGTSYANSPSNIAKLSNLYTEGETSHQNGKTIRVRAYAPGPGSKTGDNDSIFGAATGIGDTGVIMQVERAFKVASTLLLGRLRGRSISSLSVDIFGFSRGAAAARHAAHEISRGQDGLFVKLLESNGVTPPKQIETRFVGLFDCVAAIVNPIAGDLSASNNKNHPVELFLDPKKVRHAVHLTARHEHRKLFALNSLQRTDRSMPENFREIELPGAHSDIGGGYPDIMQEKVLISPFYPIPRNRQKWPEQTVQWDNLESLRQKIEEEGWIGRYSASHTRSDSREANWGFEPSLGIILRHRAHPSPDGLTEIALQMVREIHAEYSLVALRIMHALASKADVPLGAIDQTDPTLSIPKELKPIYKSLDAQISEGQDRPMLLGDHMQLIKQKYVHFSAHYNSLESVIAGRPARLELFRNMRPNIPASNKDRLVHPNSGRV